MLDVFFKFFTRETHVLCNYGLLGLRTSTCCTACEAVDHRVNIYKKAENAVCGLSGARVLGQQAAGI